MDTELGRNIFESGAQALVNPVNCVGVSGKGLAQEFKRRFPNADAIYRRVCWAEQLWPGKILPVLIETGNPHFIVYFPTKLHWREPSSMYWIKQGLRDLRSWVIEQGLRSIAIPALGCGEGGLQWEDVRGEIEEIMQFSPFDREVEVLIYPPLEKKRKSR